MEKVFLSPLILHLLPVPSTTCCVSEKHYSSWDRSSMISVFKCIILAYVSTSISTYWSFFWNISFFLLVICYSNPFLLDNRVTKVRPSMTSWSDPVLAKCNSGCYKALVDFVRGFVVIRHTPLEKNYNHPYGSCN